MKRRYLFKKVGLASIVSLIALYSCFAYSPYFHKSEKEKPVDPAIIQLQADLDSLLIEYNREDTKLGIMVNSVATNENFFSYHEEDPFMPASNLKLITSAVALEALGPDYRWQTKFYADGNISNGTLKGNLIVKAEGDPSISKELLDMEITELFKQWTDEIKANGINRIEGDLIIDNSAFDNANIGHGWKPSNKLYAYAALPSAFSINENSLRVTIKGSNTIGRAPNYTIYPSAAGLKVNNRGKTANVKRSSTRLDRSDDNTVTISGNINKNRSVTSTISVGNPANYACNVLYSEFKKHLNIVGKVSIVNTMPDYTNTKEIYIYQSPELATIIKRLNKDSNNFIANQIYLSLGYLTKNNVNETENTIREYLQKMSVDYSVLVLDDGSGLSPINQVSPKLQVDLLLAMSNSSHQKSFYESLTIAGVDGTLKKDMHFYPLYNNLRGKTGTIDRVNTLSGYLTTKDNEKLCFTILANGNMGINGDFRKLKEKILLRLTNFERVDKLYELKEI
ncbi:MAG TPA: D-alanyl-D-alanine carboxypeptidase/D-alanyl-D-alanine-endopeptidase [Candidatus Cloacimonadota bacterium]|jgi:D-alanyl-D-alanine carboxypeptidase/D-alanyl-D-alanine-endopeptidase (penicillin-binding protein 4)|nr:D-alanyl-D-alanine carboxypeptidase/D-alanyl-D-alanine-endopeptidase [Candidatus Cloacimonadales bacterium]HPY96751.1 D-alanyl-D-alanine carboxypeptidase/D-alanyl-D-alanine-endopeptidase [Candidatus Cloacimonadota bacterium]HQB41352.1 D-alanyl-D-alanine carboxypeptidase/D-alanyl-D-alanine-endopeptidase [Candidatus Cloacimonadota bacterium]